MTAQDIEIVAVQTAQDRDAFIRLPMRLHRDDPTWVAPLLMERRDALNPKKSPYLQRAEIQLWLAKRGGQVVGRISAQIDPLVAEVRSADEGHFGLLAAEDDPDIVAALVQTAEDWLTARGAIHAIGPLNFSTNQETGLLIEGHDTPPMLLMGHDLPYLAPRLEEQGYAKAKDVLAYLVEATSSLPQSLVDLAKRPPRANVVVRPIDMRNYKRDVRLIGDIFNDAWSQNWGFVPLTSDEIEALATEMRPLVDKRLVWFVEYKGKPVCFVVCLPNINEASADLDGKLLPFGWAKLIWRLKVRGLISARVPLMGLRREYIGTVRGSIFLGLMMLELRRACEDIGLQRVEMSWVLEDNLPMTQFAERMGGRVYKRYRVYRKDLT